MNEGKLKKRFNELTNKALIEADDLNKDLENILDEAKKDILKKIKEFEDEDIPDSVMKEKIIEWFGDEE